MTKLHINSTSKGASVVNSVSTIDSSIYKTERVMNRSTVPGTKSNASSGKFDFSRLVDNIMANPFMNTGMNS